MRTVRLKLVTIIAEALLQDRLLDDIKRLGARGYSVGDVSGEGSRGVRASDWEGRNVRIESVVSAPVADAILEHLSARYFPSFAVIAWVADVDVARGDKYV
jgi:hypothetical protein